MSGASEPAFPSDIEGIRPAIGMSMLDYFAAKAMEGILASIEPVKMTIPGIEFTLAEGAYDVAEAMIAERDRRSAKGEEGSDV